MKKSVFKVLFLVLIIILSVFIGTYLSYSVFSNSDHSIVSNLEISFTEKSDTVVNNDISSEILSKPYEFRIENKANVETDYKLVLNDNSDSSNSINRKNLNYQLSLNDKIIKSGKLSEIKDNIIDSEKIKGNTINNYTFKVWANSNAVYNNSYKYSIMVKLF